MASVLPWQFLAKKFGGRLAFVQHGQPATSRMWYDKESNTCEGQYDQYGDYVRYRSLELVAEQINLSQVQGNVAEAGVALGDFAWLINACFPDRKLYLYDTFEGFDNRDVELEMNSDYTTEKWFKKNKYFRNEHIKDKISVVKSKMKIPENCIFRKGYFPDTAETEKDETFAFVSIDMDLYKPISSAIDFFYPRLNHGGYIFIHDYNNLEFLGIKKAINEAESKFGNICKFPLPDSGGTLVITK